MYNSYALKSLLDRDHIFMVLESLGAFSIKYDSNGLRSSCPIHGGSSGTVFTYNPDFHLYICYGSCSYEEKDGDIIKLVQIVQKCNFDSAIEFICEVCNIDKKLIEESEDWVLEELKNKIDGILMEVEYNVLDIDLEHKYGVAPIPEEIANQLIGQKDEFGFIDSLGLGAPTLTLFESGYDAQDKRWLLPIRSPDGELLGFDGRDVTNESKSKWKKRKGLLTSKLLGRLDITLPKIQEHDKIILCEGKKDQMSIYEVGLEWVSCLYGSSLSDYQKYILDSIVSGEIIIAADGDNAGYKMVKSIVDKCYPEYYITCLEIPDNNDPADLSKKFLLELYDNRIPVEEWLKIYEYRSKKEKKKK